MLEQIKNGFYTLFLKSGPQIVVEIVNGVVYGSNIDMIDQDGQKCRMYIDETDIAVCEQLSEARFNFIREMAVRNTKIKDINSLIQLKQAVHHGKELGLVHEVSSAPVLRGPGSNEAAKNEPVVVEDEEVQDEEDYALLGAPESLTPAPPSPIPPAIVGQTKEAESNDYDGVVVDIPTPGNR